MAFKRRFKEACSQMNVYIPDGLKVQIRRAAKARGISINDVIRLQFNYHPEPKED